MGIVKKILHLILMFVFIVSSGQASNDTVFFSGQPFVKHVVDTGQSLSKIAKIYNVTTDQIKNSNELGSKLFYQQLLYVPIYLSNTTSIADSLDNLIDTTQNFKPAKVALILPYYLIENDSILNLTSDSNYFSDKFYSKSSRALSFHLGVELAIDSLEKSGKTIDLQVFDSNQDSTEVFDLIESDKLSIFDVIIGPIYSDLFSILCKKYGNDTTKILISPLSRISNNIKYPSVRKIALTDASQTKVMFDYIAKNKFEKDIIILRDEKNVKLSINLTKKFNSANKLVRNMKIEDYSEIFSDYDSIPDQVIIVLSKNKASITRLLSKISSIGVPNSIFTFESVHSYSNLDVNMLVKLNLHFPHSRLIDLKNIYDLSFLKNYEEKYKTNVFGYTKTGYDIIMHFFGDSDIFRFKEEKNGYKENVFVPLFNLSDYEFNRLN